MPLIVIMMPRARAEGKTSAKRPCPVSKKLDRIDIVCLL